MYRSSRGEVGSTTALFVALVLPIVMVMLSLTVELSHYFGILDEMQKISDHEAHEAIARGLSPHQVQANVINRMKQANGMASGLTVQATIFPHQAQVTASADYQGAFYQFIQEFTGVQQVLPLQVSSTVRLQTTAALIIVDRRVPVGTENECDDVTLAKTLIFAERLAQTWSGVTGVQTRVAVTPGATELVNFVSPSGGDGITRCHPKSSSTGFELTGIRGVQSDPLDATALSFDILDLSSPAVFSPTVERRNVVFLMRNDGWAQGYSSMTHGVLDSEAQKANVSIDMVSVVANGDPAMVRRSEEPGVVGTFLRVVGASDSELSAVRLVSTVARMVTDRTVLER